MDPTGGRAMRITCVGAGPAGLYFGVLMKLRHPGCEITIYERNPAGATYGWGLVFWDDLLEQLQRADPVSAREISSTAPRWVDQVVDLDGTAYSLGGEGYSIPRQALLDILARRAVELGVRIEYLHEVDSLSELGAADLIVASDGANSRLREGDAGRFGTEVDLGRNKYVWLGASTVFRSFTFPFVGTESGWVWAHAYGIDENTSTFIVECPPETWSGLGFGTMAARKALDSLESIFAPCLQGGRLLAHVADDAPLPWLNFRRITNERWHEGNVVLMGDAAHTAHFTIGSGTKLAIEDAIGLVQCLDRHEDVRPALAEYERERRASLLRAQSDAFYSARWFENVPRYIELKPTQFVTLMGARRSPLQPRLDPRLFYGLHRVSEEVTVLRALRRRMSAGVRALQRRRTARGPERRSPESTRGHDGDDG